MPRSNVTRFAVLGLLGLKPRSGYDIKQFVERVMGHFWHESYRWIYKTLGELEDDALVSSRNEEHGQRPRAVYRITGKGRRIFQEWLEAPVAPPTQRDELLLKLLLGPKAPARSAHHLKQYLEQLRQEGAELAAAEQSLPSIDLDAATRQRLGMTLEHRRRVTAATLRWAEEALRQLGPSPPRRAAAKKRRQ